MNLSLTEEAMIQDKARKFAQNTMGTVAAQLDRCKDDKSERPLILRNLK